MGRINNDRKIHFAYEPEFIEWYKSCCESFKVECARIGAPTGFSSMNVAYVVYMQYILQVNTTYTPTPYQRN